MLTKLIKLSPIITHTHHLRILAQARIHHPAAHKYPWMPDLIRYRRDEPGLQTDQTLREGHRGTGGHTNQ